MSEEPSDLDLMAYADGELDALASTHVSAYVAAQPAAAAKVKLFQQLRQATTRVVQSESPAVPISLLQSIQDIPLETPAQTRPASRWRIGYTLSALAATLVIGISLAYVLFNSSNDTRAIPGGNLIPAAYVQQASAVHVNCSQLASHFHPNFADNLRQLPDSLHTYLGSAVQTPDLEKMGYAFAGCGPCSVPGGKTAHLLYKSKANPGESLSLFVQTDAGQLPALKDQTVYYEPPANQSKPMIVWRKDGVVHYLVANDAAHIEQAAKTMGIPIKI